jgi:aminoglycoside phosphotransferase (APT) family kinase protein
MSPADLTESLASRAELVAQGWRPGAHLTDVAPLTGGTSSLTFAATVRLPDDTELPVVLKMAPPGLPPVRNRDILRQSRVLRALADVPGFPVPAVLFDDAGTAPADPPFLAMTRVEGECVEPGLGDDTARAATDPTEIRARAFDAARLLARLHALDPARLGLAGEPVTTLADEIARWTQALSTVSPELQGRATQAAAALAATAPEPLPPVLVHGDYRLGNMLCADGRVRAVIDWEIWTVGDPRMDVTWLTFFCDDQEHPAAPRTTRPSGVPTTAELTDAYLDARGEELPDLRWFQALTRYKEVSATALLVKRAQKAGPLDDLQQRMLGSLPVLVDETLALLA